MPICDPYDTCGTTKVVEMSIPYCGVKMFASKYYGTASGDFLNGRGPNIPLSGLFAILNEPSVQAVTGVISWSSIQLSNDVTSFPGV